MINISKHSKRLYKFVLGDINVWMLDSIMSGSSTYEYICLPNIRLSDAWIYLDMCGNVYRCKGDDEPGRQGMVHRVPTDKKKKIYRIIGQFFNEI